MLSMHLEILEALEPAERRKKLTAFSDTLASLSAAWPGEILRVRQQGTYALSKALALCPLP